MDPEIPSLVDPAHPAGPTRLTEGVLREEETVTDSAPALISLAPTSGCWVYVPVQEILPFQTIHILTFMGGFPKWENSHIFSFNFYMRASLK